MQPGATVVLATVWLAVYANLVGTLRINFTADQYSPLAPQHQRHEVYRRAEGQPSLWKDSNSGFQGRSHESSLLARRSRDSAADDFSSLAEDKRLGGESTDERTDNRGTNGALESSQRELSPPAEFEDPFVADDTFQDQGPGSVEIYKLDVFRVNSLLRPSSPRFPLPSKNKSKVPKKTSQASWKSKTPDYGKATGLLNTFRKQSNSFDDLSTEVPPANTDGSFGIGGVPELQVGCEGLEAAESDHGRERRSIDTGDKNLKREVDSSLVDVTPISLNLDYELSGEEGYEEMDELLKLKKLESTTKRSRQNRGDMDATLHSVFQDGKHRVEKLPVRGDLGKSRASNESSVERQSNRQVEEKTRLADEALRFNEGKRDDYPGAARSDDGTSTGNQRRKILWLEDPDVEQQLKGNEERRKRDTWGFGEDEGVVSSDELQTENQRRRLAYERQNMIRQEELRRREEQRRRAEEALRRNQIENRTNSDIERIREEYDRRLSEREREEEERRRQLQQSNRWQLDEEHRRRLQEEVSRRNRLEEQRRAQELEALRRRETVIQKSASEEERKRQWQQAIEMKRPKENQLTAQEAHRTLQEVLRRRQQEQDRRSLEERRREWMLKRRQEEEEERRRHQQSRNEPSNLLHPSRSSPNSDKSYDPETERRLREQQERERQRKLNEYVQRNRPIKVNSSIDREREEANERRQQEERRRAEEQRQRLETERKLQDYVRRNQPVRVSKLNDSYYEYRRRLDEARQRNQSRYTGPGSGRRNHGPSAPTNIDPRYYVDDARREAARRIEEEERIRERQRQQEQQEELRRYALRREEEARRMQSRRYEEERKRQEAVRLEAEKRAKELQEEEARRSQAGRRPLENTRPSYEDRRRFDDYRRRQDTSLIPTNLVLNESRRAAERQRQEQERRRAEAERQRAREAREKEERDRVMKEHRRRQEEARLNALPVSASIIVKPATPNLSSRINFNIPRLNPYEDGIKVSNFPAPPTRQPPVKSPPPCVWAVVHCCPSKVNRLVTCFESMGCPGINWDPSPCRTSIMQAAKNRVAKFYEETEDRDEYDYS